MIEKPILFSGSMVRAILDGRKTMTRRVVKPQPKWMETPTLCDDGIWKGRYQYYCGNPENPGIDVDVDEAKAPYAPGDRLWVRETWVSHDRSKFKNYLIFQSGQTWIKYKADGKGTYDTGEIIKWRPSIFMPRWASRITLEATAVRCERLQEISVADIQKEGLFVSLNQDPCDMADQLREKFKDLWDSINGKKYPWKDNPWVWVYEFKKASRD